MNRELLNLAPSSTPSLFISPPSSLDEWTLTAPGIHGESVPMRDLSREEVDFCIVGAGAGGGVLGAKLAEAAFDGSVFTTSTGVNPSLTIEAIAARTADRLALKVHP